MAKNLVLQEENEEKGMGIALMDRDPEQTLPRDDVQDADFSEAAPHVEQGTTGDIAANGFDPETVILLNQLKGNTKATLRSQINSADIIGQLGEREDVNDHGGLEQVIAQNVGKGWSKSTISKYKLVYTELIKPVERDYVDELLDREESTIKDFEIFYLSAQMVKASDGQLSPFEAMSRMYDLTRDEAKEKLASVKKKAPKAKADDDTWGEFTERLPSDTIVDLQTGIATSVAASGLTSLQWWQTLALLLNDLPVDELTHLMKSGQHGHARHIRILAPDLAYGAYVFADGTPAQEMKDMYAAILVDLEEEKAAADAKATQPEVTIDAPLFDYMAAPAPQEVVDAEFSLALPESSDIPEGHTPAAEDDAPVIRNMLPGHIHPSWSGTEDMKALDVDAFDKPEMENVPDQEAWPAGVSWEGSRGRYKVAAKDQHGKRYTVARAKNYMTALALLMFAQEKPGWKPDEDFAPIFADTIDLKIAE